MKFENMKEILYTYFENCADAIGLAFAIGGENVETAQRILYYYTGWMSFEGFLDELEEDE